MGIDLTVIGISAAAGLVILLCPLLLCPLLLCPLLLCPLLLCPLLLLPDLRAGLREVLRRFRTGG